MKDSWSNVDDLIADTNELLDGEKNTPDPAENYSDWLYAQSGGTPIESVQPPVRDRTPRRKKKKHMFWKVLLVLVLLACAAFAVLWFFLAKQPVGTGTEERKPGNSVILLAGTDADGTRTDTMVLLSVNEPEKTVSLISLPRDTYVSGYRLPKLNSAFGAAGGGDSPEDGMEGLMDAVTRFTGYRPDGYVLVNLDSFRTIVDAIGGVEFNVPMDMDYEDPTQDLYIHLAAGEQILDGEQSMELVRFRSGYPRADLQRVEIQRDFLKAAMQQTLQMKNILKAPRLMTTVLTQTTTDLKAENLAWLAKTMLVCDKDELTMETLPGSPQMIGGGSYYVMDAYATADLLNACCNPYVAAVDAAALG